MNPEPDDRLLYYRGAAEFWYSAIQLQHLRCMREDIDGATRRTDLSFFIVAVQRLREVARMMRERARLESAGAALAEFERAWPRVKELRDFEEHIRGPSGRPPEGIWYFGEFAADLKAGGQVEYVAHADQMMPAVDRLFKEICALLPDLGDEIGEGYPVAPRE